VAVKTDAWVFIHFLDFFSCFFLHFSRA